MTAEPLTTGGVVFTGTARTVIVFDVADALPASLKAVTTQVIDAAASAETNV
jgi:hypothetical protein